jgi:hypothetical protein
MITEVSKHPAEERLHPDPGFPLSRFPATLSVATLYLTDPFPQLGRQDAGADDKDMDRIVPSTPSPSISGRPRLTAFVDSFELLKD